MEFLSGGNIFSRNFSINLCKGRVILEGENIFSKIPPESPLHQFCFCTVGGMKRIYIYNPNMSQFIGNKAFATFMPGGPPMKSDGRSEC